MTMEDGHGGSEDGRNSPTSMIPIDDADSLLSYKIRNNREPTGCGAVYRIHPETEARLMYFGFSFDGIGSGEWYASRQEVFRMICDWFMGDRDTPLGETNIMPGICTLDPAYPNPFNSTVRLKFTLPEVTEYRLTITDLNGREVDLLGSGSASAGYYYETWNAAGMPSGIYFARLTAIGNAPVERKLVLVK